MRSIKPFLFCIIFQLIILNTVLAAEPPSEPILKIETGMHTAPIRRIGVDSNERFIVTGSQDKTIKLWEAGSGRLIKTLRPPIGEGHEGKIYAVAISPDGRHIAAGGYSGYEWDKSHSIYIFERDTGAITARLTGLPNVIPHLSYSRDGRYLVACLGEKNGIRVYGVSGSGRYNPVFEDKDYGGQSYWAAFDASGRLATSSLDGYIRLYDKNFRLIYKKKAVGGGRPFGVSFSPDGRKIAVGFIDTKSVDIYSGVDLRFIQTLDTKGIDYGDLFIVSFTPDGRFILAGGGAQKSINNEWINIIRRWDTARPKYTDIPVAKDAIMGIIPLKSGGVVFASCEPSFGLIDRQGSIYYTKKPDIADFRDNLQGFTLSHEGSTVGFGYEYGGKSPAWFDIDSLNLTLSPSDRGLLPPVTQGRSINVTDWKNNYYPKLNGKNIKLELYEYSRSLAILPDESGFVLGTSSNLRLYDRGGSLKWRVAVPGNVWAVNVSKDSRLIVAAFGDGTIRWYRIEDGKELLVLFPHRDKKRWVLWTPKGYYTSSPGADELIGWHINNGSKKEADFFPASRFRDRFYRPDVIAKVLKTCDEEKAIALANEESGRKRMDTSIKDILPPVVTIISPQDGARLTKSELTVRYSIRNPSGEPVTAIKVLIDGRPVSQQRGVMIKPKGEEAGELKIDVPERDFELSLIAENKYSASVPSTVRLFWVGKKEEFVIKPKLYILAVGVSKYKDESLRLQFAHKDAEDFVKTMQTQKGKLYEDVVVKLLTDYKATKDETLDGLEWLQKETTHKDVAMLFIAGHGINDPAGIYYFLPQNADLEKLKRTAIAFSDIKNTVSSIAGKVVMFVDTCHAGRVMGKRAIADITGVINELTSAENGVVVFSSSTGRQYSLEDTKWGNGAFTKAVIEGIAGKADLLGKGKITVNMLDAFIAERVKEITNGKQTPVTTKPNTVPDFPIAVR